MSGVNVQTSSEAVGVPSSSPSDRGRLENGASSAASPRQKAIRYFRCALVMRRERDKRFGAVFSQDRGWELLLLLMIARLEDRRITAREVFDADEIHGVTMEDLDRQIASRAVILIEGGDVLDDCQIALSDEAARHMVDLFRIASAQE